MARIGNNDQVALGEDLVQFPRTAGWTDHVIPSLYNHSWDVGDEFCVVENMGFFDKDSVDEVMAFDAS